MSLPALASDPGQIERAADPAAFVVLACERAKQWLAEALEQGQIEDIVELKSQAEAIRVYTAQKQIGKDAELAAAEIVRRAERGIGVAIRRGQLAGRIRRPGDDSRTDLPGRDLVADDNKVSVGSFGLAGDELSRGPYALTDGVSDAEFDTAVRAARGEENLARANVVRKIKAVQGGGPLHDVSTPVARRQRIRELAEGGYTSRQIAEMVGLSGDRVRHNAREMGIAIPADVVIGKTRRHDPNRIVEETVNALDGLRMGLELVDFDGLDRSKIPHWSSSLRTSLRSLNRFLKELDQ